MLVALSDPPLVTSKCRVLAAARTVTRDEAAEASSTMAVLMV